MAFTADVDCEVTVERIGSTARFHRCRDHLGLRRGTPPRDEPLGRTLLSRVACSPEVSEEEGKQLLEDYSVPGPK